MARDEPRLLVLALYVRDAAGLEVVADPPVPPLEPAVARSNEAPPVAAAVQWPAWWRDLVAGEAAMQHGIEAAGGGREAVRVMAARHMAFGPPDFAGLSGSPDLRELVASHFHDAEAWSGPSKREFCDRSRARDRALLETHLVHEVARGLGRKARPFRLQVSVLPVAGAQHWRVAEDHVLATRDLYFDAPAWRRALEPIVSELA
jgi:hypothetical protein